MINNQKGMTLLELIITLVIVAIVFTLIAPLFVSGVRFFGDINTNVIEQSNLRKIMTDMSREIRDATDVTVLTSTKIEVDDCIYEYDPVNRQITKYFSDTATLVVVSKEVESFEVTQEDTMIKFVVKADGANTTIVTKINVRQRAVPTPEIV